MTHTHTESQASFRANTPQAEEPQKEQASAAPRTPSVPETSLNKAVNATKTPKESRTTGEKIFNWLTYGGLAGVGTFVASVVAAYAFKYSSRGFPNMEANPSGPSFSDKWKEWGAKIAELPFIRNSGDPARVGEDTLMTTALMMGGNLFVVPIRWMEGSKKEIVHSLNTQFGKEGEAEKGDEQIQNEPSQSWGSLLKGRITAWLVVFTSLTAAAKVIGPQMGQFENWLGNKAVDGYTAVNPNMSERAEFRTRKIGELSAIDAFATVAASILLFFTSKIFAQKAENKQQTQAPVPQQPAQAEAPAREQNQQKTVEPVRETPLTKDALENDYVTLKDYRKKVDTPKQEKNEKAPLTAAEYKKEFKTLKEYKKAPVDKRGNDYMKNRAEEKAAANENEPRAVTA